jgi:hypothetical protein
MAPTAPDSSAIPAGLASLQSAREAHIVGQNLTRSVDALLKGCDGDTVPLLAIQGFRYAHRCASGFPSGWPGALREIDRRAGQRFRDVRLPEITDDDPPSVEELAGYAVAGRGWIALHDADRPHRDLARTRSAPSSHAVRAVETAHGLDPTRRVCMRLELTD